MRKKEKLMDTTCTIKPWTHLFTKEIISGREGEGEGQNGSEGTEGNDPKDGEEGAGSGSEGSQGADPKDDDKDDKDDDTSGLKRALAQERADRKKFEKDARKLQAEKDERELADKTEVEQAQIKAQQATERSERLAAGLLRRDIDAAIAKAASSFVDPTDAIDGVDRSAITFEQDEDDPTDITIDYKSVEKEVKRLAAKKPHFVKQGTDDGNATGGQFGGQKPKGKTTEETYKERYPSL